METNHPRILVADSEPESIRPLVEVLQEEGVEVTLLAREEEILEAVREERYDLVILGEGTSPGENIGLLQKILKIDPDQVVILTTGFSTLEEAKEAVDLGAFDLISKPLMEEETRLTVRRALQKSRLARENRLLREELGDRFGFEQVLVKDRRMEEVLSVAAAVADTKATILLTGESGTGKSLLARAIHVRSSRRDGPFVEVNCGALPDTLLESELFGHAKGAFTGAVRDKPGKFERAHGGTIFLDEIATASPALQVKLLRVLQEKTLERVGEDKTRTVDVRVILATNVDLSEEVKKGRFREDLFYRVQVVTLEIPPLRERPDDVIYLARHFLERFAGEYNRPVKGFSPEAAALLLSWKWPGNVRELQNAVERAVVLAKGPLVLPSDLPPWMLDQDKTSSRPGEAPGLQGRPGTIPREGGAILPLKEALARAEKAIILEALDAFGWNRTRTAKALGIDRTTLFHKMRRHKIQPPSPGGSRRPGPEVAPGNSSG